MRLLILLFGFAVIAHVKCQVNIEDILYGEDDEEDDQEPVTTTTTTIRTTTRPTPRHAVPAAVETVQNLLSINLRQGLEPLPLNSTMNVTVSTGVNSNHTFVVKPANGTFFGTEVESNAPVVGGTTERVHFVLGQVGNIWNNVGRLNVSGIVDQALGIRNSQIARPIVTGILNIVFCNPLTFSNNNCQASRQG